MSLCQCTLIPFHVLGKLWKELGGRQKMGVLCPLPPLSCSQHQIGDHNVGPHHRPGDSPAQLKHKDRTVYCSGNSQTLFRQESNREKIKQHMILVKAWLSQLPCYLSLLCGVKGDDRNGIIGTFYSCAPWGFKNEMTSVARGNEQKEVSCGGCEFARVDRLLQVILCIHAK